MNKEDLIALREEILLAVTPLVIEEASNGSDRFQLLIRIIRAGNANADVYKKAFECAKSIDDNSEKFDALLELLDEIDIDIDNKPVISAPITELNHETMQ